MKGHLFYTTSSFVHYFKSISEFKLTYSPETLSSGQNWRFFVPCDLEIWQMTLKNNRTPLPCYFKLCASFCSNWFNSNWSYSPETPNLGKKDDFLAVWPCNLTYHLEKQLGTSSMLLQASCIISQPLVNWNWSYSPETPNLGKIGRFFVNLKFDWGPWKSTRHLS